jgi:hypothetical protein
MKTMENLDLSLATFKPQKGKNLNANEEKHLCCNFIHISKNVTTSIWAKFNNFLGVNV